MPRWVLAIVVAISAIGAAMTVVLLQQGGRAKGQQQLRSVNGPRATIIVPGHSANAASVAVDSASGTKVLTPRAGMEGYAVPAFRLVNQDGRPVTEAIFDGKVTILNFIFTHCVTACPPMNANMLRVYHELADTGVQFVSISVDPAHDTPERLREYAAGLGVDTRRWVFLTGEPGEAQRVCDQSLKFEVSEDPDTTAAIPLADGTTMANIRHPIKLFLVGPDRAILDFCAHQVDADRERLAAIARRAAE